MLDGPFPIIVPFSTSKGVFHRNGRNGFHPNFVWALFLSVSMKLLVPSIAKGIQAKIYCGFLFQSCILHSMTAVLVFVFGRYVATVSGDGCWIKLLVSCSGLVSLGQLSDVGSRGVFFSLCQLVLGMSGKEAGVGGGKGGGGGGRGGGCKTGEVEAQIAA